MLATIREAAPRSGVASSVAAGTAGAGAGAAAAGAAAPGLGRRRPAAGRLGLRGGDRGGPVVGEELPPALADRVGIGQEAVVHVVDQPRIGAERASRATELGHGPTLPAALGSHGAGRVASALPMSYPAALHLIDAAGRRTRARPRWSSSTDRSTGGTASGGSCAACPSSPSWPTTGGATRARGAAGSWTSGATSTTSSRSRTRCGPRAAAPWSAVGHSLGGDVVIGAALAAPRAFDAIGAFEPPMPWLGFRRAERGGRPVARPWPTTRARRPSGSSAGW